MKSCSNSKYRCGYTLSGRTGNALAWRVRASVAAAILAICSPHLHRAIHGAHGVLPMRVEGATS